MDMEASIHQAKKKIIDNMVKMLKYMISYMAKVLPIFLGIKVYIFNKSKFLQGVSMNIPNIYDVFSNNSKNRVT